ncbi:MAG: 50S ribosomal protein L11 methyltransferase [Clostridia bacterium]|nr:50S ribosomal protein L11 methyltransferase [Clostridia bacterium]
MDWIQVTVYTTTEGIEPVSGRLYQLGVTGIEIEDESEFYSFLEETRGTWDYVDDDLVERMKGETKVRIYLSDNAAGRDMLHSVRDSISQLALMDEEKLYGRLEISLDNVNEEDWANNWKQYFKPLTVGDKILILPEWETLNEETDRTVFTVNPGMSFGTGSHNTTQLCIEELENVINKDTHVLDLGCGSGILSIIALLLGAPDATAVDIDPNAVDIAYQNAERNGIDKSVYRAFAGNVLADSELIKKISDKKYEVVVANIVADVIIALADIVPELIAPDGIYITSGIITNRKEDVIARYKESDFEIINIREKGDWVSIVMKRK